MPEMMTQGKFLEKGRNLSKAVSEEESLLILARVLAECDRKKYPELFSQVNAPDFSQCFYLAKLLGSFLKELHLGGMTLQEALQKAPAADFERRSEILQLEKLYQEKLASYGLYDRFSLLHFTLPQTQETALSREEDLAHIKKIIVCGVPGLLPAVQKRLENFADTRELEIWIQADISMSGYFDEWGNPLPEKWENVAFEQPQAENIFFHTEKASDLPRLAAAVAGRRGYMDNSKSSFVCADAALMPFFKAELQKLGGNKVQFYDPAGVSFGRTRVGKLLRKLIDFARVNSFETFRSLIQQEDYLYFCSMLVKKEGNLLLAELDELMLEHLPDRVSAILPFASQGMKKIIEKSLQIRELLLDSSGVMAEKIAGILTEIYSEALTRKDTENISFEAQAAHLENFLKKCVSSRIIKHLSREEFFQLLENMLQSDVLYGELAPKRVEIHGFLELPNISAGELLICGMSDSLVPEKIQPNPFINDSQRLALGLPGNPHRAARDAFYLYESIARRRKKGGVVRFFASKFSADGTPVRFSPFLFRGKMDKMLDKASLLFSAPVPMSEKKSCEKEFSNTFYFRIPLEKYQDKLENIKISVTSFSTYLESPLYFFLKNIMRMEKEEYSVRELDDLAFGNACHGVFEALKEEDCKDLFHIQGKMKELLEKYLQNSYGDELPFLVDFQKDFLLQRLYAAAPVLLEEKKNFRLLCQEYTLGGRKEEGGEGSVVFGRIRISGRIDRMELSRDGKTLRVLDFKTSNTAKDPKSAHCKGKDDALEFIGLQLPLYVILLRRDPFFRKKFPHIDPAEIRIECGYFNLPKAVTETGIRIWNDMEDIMEKAERKVEEISEELVLMKQGIFRGDPDRKISYGAFDDLFRNMPSAVLRGIKFPDVGFDPQIRDLYCREKEKEALENAAHKEEEKGGNDDE